MRKVWTIKKAPQATFGFVGINEKSEGLPDTKVMKSIAPLNAISARLLYLSRVKQAHKCALDKCRLTQGLHPSVYNGFFCEL
jgi:hypothetical protein